MREANSGTGTPGHSGGPCCGHLASGCEMEVAPYNDYQRQDTGCDPDAQARAASGHDGADPGHHACSAENPFTLCRFRFCRCGGGTQLAVTASTIGTADTQTQLAWRVSAIHAAAFTTID